MIEITGHMTVPKIFISSLHVGGSDDLDYLSETGKPDALHQCKTNTYQIVLTNH